MLKKIGRILAIVIAVLVILLSVGGIFGAWGLSNTLSDVTVKVFGVIQGGVNVVDTAVGRVNSLIDTARSEVQQAGQTVNNIAANLQENHPILTALSERVETRLGPGVDKIQEALSPVHDALTTVGSAVSFANSLPFVQERVPGLEKVDQTLTRLGTLGANLQQLRSTLRALLDEKADKLTQAAATALTDLTTRIDGGLANVQSDVQTLQSDIAAMQARLQQRQSQMLLIYNLFALAMTLFFAWVIYSQVVVIRHHWPRIRRAAVEVPATAAAEPPAPAAAATDVAPTGIAPANVAPTDAAPTVSTTTDVVPTDSAMTNGAETLIPPTA